MKSKRAKATNITKKVKDIVWARDKERCIICGSPNAYPNAHYISRAKGGLGIEENIVTLCIKCHEIYDHSTCRENYKALIKAYLKATYKDWNEEELYYKKYDFIERVK